MYDLENLCANIVHASLETQQVGKLSMEVVLIPGIHFGSPNRP